jgi:uncharacterized protein YndB with AHSA1/START domain
MEWKRATFGWKECSNPCQLGRNVKRERGGFQHDLQNIGQYRTDVGPVGPRCMELPHHRPHGTYLQRLLVDVWRVWNDADSIKKWWGPKGYTALVVRNDVQQGGSYLWAMKSEQGRMFWSTGTYKEVVANKKIVSTMSFSNENGKVIPGSQVTVPGKWPNEIAVIVEFSESQGKARVTVAEIGIPLIVYPLSKIGWAQQFDKIQLLL